MCIRDRRRLIINLRDHDFEDMVLDHIEAYDEVQEWYGTRPAGFLETRAQTYLDKHDRSGTGKKEEMRYSVKNSTALHQISLQLGKSRFLVPKKRNWKSLLQLRRHSTIMKPQPSTVFEFDLQRMVNNKDGILLVSQTQNQSLL